MITLMDFSLLGANTARTKAYLQVLARNGYAPKLVILMNEDSAKLIDEAREFEKVDYVFSRETHEYFRLDEPVVTTINRLGIPFEILPTNTVNDELTISTLSKIDTPFIIYSGFGGQILRKGVLSIGKKFLHIHPGFVPQYRGSTTVYYSLIKEGRVGASAIFLEEKIDTGPVLKAKWYDIPQNVPDLDYIFDPYVRATLLTEVITDYLKSGKFELMEQQADRGETYYIIHPVLKHIAILSLQKQGREKE